jgi:hypothetical protein
MARPVRRTRGKQEISRIYAITLNNAFDALRRIAEKSFLQKCKFVDKNEQQNSQGQTPGSTPQGVLPTSDSVICVSMTAAGRLLKKRKREEIK